MERAKTPVINDELVSTAELNEKAPKPKRQRFSWQKALKHLVKLPWPQISIGVVVVAAIVFFGVSTYRHNNVNIATRSALDGFLKNRNNDITFKAVQTLYGSGDSPYQYTGTLSLRNDQLLRANFSTTRDTKVEYNKGKLSQTEFIVNGGTSYLKFNINGKLSYTGYDFKGVNGKWYRYDVASSETVQSALYTIGQQLVVNNDIDANRLACAVKASDALNDKTDRDAIVSALIDSKFIKLSDFKSDKNGRYVSVSVDGDHYADFAKAYRQTAYAKKVQGCLPKDSADLFGSEIVVRETAGVIKKDKPNVKLYLSGFTTSNIRRVEYKSNSDENMIGKLIITADFKRASGKTETPSRATEINNIANKLVVSSGE